MVTLVFLADVSSQGSKTSFLGKPISDEDVWARPTPCLIPMRLNSGNTDSQLLLGKHSEISGTLVLVWMERVLLAPISYLAAAEELLFVSGVKPSVHMVLQRGGHQEF